jgi:hypothetical protein
MLSGANGLFFSSSPSIRSLKTFTHFGSTTEHSSTKCFYLEKSNRCCLSTENQTFLVTLLSCHEQRANNKEDNAIKNPHF